MIISLMNEMSMMRMRNARKPLTMKKHLFLYLFSSFSFFFIGLSFPLPPATVGSEVAVLVLHHVTPLAEGVADVASRLQLLTSIPSALNLLHLLNFLNSTVAPL